MNRLHDLVRIPRPPRMRLPEWLRPIVTIGIVSDDPDIRRRQTFTNVGAYAVAASALSHLVINGIWHFWDLMPIHAYNLALAVLALLTHRLHRFGENAGAMFLSVVVFLGHNYVVFALGLDAGLQIYFTLAGAMLFIFGIQNWRLFLIFYAIAFTGLVASFQLAEPDGFLVPHDHDFREFLELQGLVNTFVINALLIAYVLSALRHAELQAAHEHARSEALLDVILPAAIAARLKSGRERRIADHVDCATVLFADISGFTPASRRVSAEELVGYLHELVSAFDALCASHGVDKIKTIGDSYMAVGGLSGEARDGAVRIGRLALAMQQAMARHGKLGEHPVALRIGIHSGPLVAGVIGDTRIAYDVWGDTVNLAQRMEAHGAAGRIHVSQAFAALVKDVFVLEKGRRTSVKGVGEVDTAYLSRPREPASGQTCTAATAPVIAGHST
jgi:adenylate cyclase